MGQSGTNWRGSKLETLAAVESAAPQRALRIADIRHPFSIPGEIEVSHGHSPEIGDKRSRLWIVANQLSAGLVTDHKQFLAIFTENWSVELNWSGGELYGFRRYPTRELASIGQQPDVADTITHTLEHVVLSIGSPIAAAFLGRVIPAGE